MLGLTPSNNKPNNLRLNQYPLWKYILILVLFILGLIYALPNIFGDSPGLQITVKDGKSIPESSAKTITQALAKANIKIKKIESTEYHSNIIFYNNIDSTKIQLKAQNILHKTLGNNYIIALYLAPNTPKWLLGLGATPMKYGLDLRGGMYFLLDIDMQTVYNNNLNTYLSEIRPLLIKNNIRYSKINIIPEHGIVMLFRSAKYLTQAQKLFSNLEQFADLTISPKSGKNPADKLTLYANLSAAKKKEQQTFASQQIVETMRHRVDELGVSEASVSREGLDRVVIELPGVQNPAKAKEIISGTASLKLMLVNESAELNNIPIGSKLYHSDEINPNTNKPRSVILYNRAILTGDAISGAISTFDQQNNEPVVQVRLSGNQVSHFSKITGENIGHKMAILLEQTSFSKQKIKNKIVTKTSTTRKVVSIATIRAQLGNVFIIQGVGTMNQAQNLALKIRAGALPAPVQIAQNMTIGPSLGADNIKKGTMSVIIAMLLVMLFMLVYYRLFGLIANIALILNLIFIVAVMSIIPGATLSLPGIAGIVLNVAMAIDSNVLIFERIREELRNKNTSQSAINTGYEKAFATIIDSNLTTLIVAVILYAVGTGPIKGFAVTLIIGIICSMFTAITVTRAIVNWWYGKRNIKTLSIGI